MSFIPESLLGQLLPIRVFTDAAEARDFIEHYDRRADKRPRFYFRPSGELIENIRLKSQRLLKIFDDHSVTFHSVSLRHLRDNDTMATGDLQKIQSMEGAREVAIELLESFEEVLPLPKKYKSNAETHFAKPVTLGWHIHRGCKSVATLCPDIEQSGTLTPSLSPFSARATPPDSALVLGPYHWHKPPSSRPVLVTEVMHF